ERDGGVDGSSRPRLFPEAAGPGTSELRARGAREGAGAGPLARVAAASAMSGRGTRGGWGGKGPAGEGAAVSGGAVRPRGRRRSIAVQRRSEVKERGYPLLSDRASRADHASNERVGWWRKQRLCCILYQN